MAEAKLQLVQEARPDISQEMIVEAVNKRYEQKEAQTLVPGLVLLIISIGLVIFFFDRFLFSYDMLLGLLAIGSVLILLWWGWTQIPLYFRKTIHRWLQRHERDRNQE